MSTNDARADKSPDRTLVPFTQPEKRETTTCYVLEHTRVWTRDVDRDELPALIERRCRDDGQNVETAVVARDVSEALEEVAIRVLRDVPLAKSPMWPEAPVPEYLGGDL